MKLLGLRRFAIRKQVRIRFPIGDDLYCEIDAHGVARVPGLDAVPPFNLESKLDEVVSFQLIPSQGESPKNLPSRLSRPELEQMIASLGAAPGAAHDPQE